MVSCSAAERGAVPAAHALRGLRAVRGAVALPRTLLTGTQPIGHSAQHVVGGYFGHHGVPHRTEDDRIVAELSGGGAVEVTFDAAGRIAGVEAGILP
ncbi:hypothetical protein [Streptomyces nodosus]|uniref:hypothetical protein n=1 Tax=Streptomyces nodosus TaxID=40318 RepID=UPI0037F6F168